MPVTTGTLSELPGSPRLHFHIAHRPFVPLETEGDWWAFRGLLFCSLCLSAGIIQKSLKENRNSSRMIIVGTEVRMVNSE